MIARTFGSLSASFRSAKRSASRPARYPSASKMWRPSSTQSPKLSSSLTLRSTPSLVGVLAGETRQTVSPGLSFGGVAASPMLGVFTLTRVLRIIRHGEALHRFSRYLLGHETLNLLSV